MLHRRFKVDQEGDTSNYQSSQIPVMRSGVDQQNSLIYNQGIQGVQNVSNIQGVIPVSYSQFNNNTSQMNQTQQQQQQGEITQFTENDQLYPQNPHRTDASFLQNQTLNDQSYFQDQNTIKKPTFIQPLKQSQTPSKQTQNFEIEQQNVKQSTKLNNSVSTKSKKLTKKQKQKELLDKAGKKRNVMRAIRKFLQGDGEVESHIFPKTMKNPPREIFFDTVLPFSLMFFVLTLIYAIQQETHDYCYIDDENLKCACENSNVKFWSFVKQMILYKLSHLSYRRIIMKSLVKENPYIESFLFYFFTMGIDFVMVLYIEQNKELVYLVIVYVLGLIIPSHILRYSNFLTALWQSRGLIFYDGVYVLCFVYIFYALPSMFKEICNSQGFSQGRVTFYICISNFWYCFSTQILQLLTHLFILKTLFLEIILEVILDLALSFANYAEFYIYQMQNVLLGLRVGILVSTSHKDFEFWYLLVFFALKRLNTQTQVINITLRRIIQNCMSQKQARHLRLSEIYKGKNGAYMESAFLWLFVFYFLWSLEFFFTHQVNDVIIVKDCLFNSLPKFGDIPWYRPLVIWVCLLFGEVTGIFLNQETQLDTIKWTGAKEFSLIDNMLTRITGWYLFQIAMVFPMVKLQYEGQALFMDLRN